MFLSPKELDQQSVVILDGWLDLDSERWRSLDSDPKLTKKWLLLLLEEPPSLFLDRDGRVWLKGKEDIFYPYHIESGKKKYGIRISKKAAN